MPITETPHRPYPETNHKTPQAPGLNRAKPSPIGHPAPVVCDLSDLSPFTTNYKVPPAPVLAAFGGGPMHQFRMKGANWDMRQAAADHAGALLRSARHQHPEAAELDEAERWDDLLFQFEPQAFLHVEHQLAITGWATTPAEAERLTLEFEAQYKLPWPTKTASFVLIKASENRIGVESVPLKSSLVFDHQSLDLHYGDGFSDWHESFVCLLAQKNSSLTILEGPPGTGKTSYLRHLMGVLKESHRFYFIPPSNLKVLSRPDFIDFWVSQRNSYSDRKFVVILEDAEDAIMTRGRDNSEHVSAILNLTDGMLASFIKLQIICTMNCQTTEIDQALLRPGRLLCHRVFGRLDRASALRLAESIGQTLPVKEDYSLAEIFAGADSSSPGRMRIGFGT
jgi:hypothetical protein